MDKYYRLSLTGIEANHAAEVGVCRFLLDAHRIVVAYSAQVIVHHLKRSLGRVQPPDEGR